MDSPYGDDVFHSFDDNSPLEDEFGPKDEHDSDVSTNSEFDYDFFPDFERIESMFRVEYDGLTLYGEGLPPLDDIKLSYRDAWRIAKQGCQCICRKFSEPKSFNVTYFATSDGTDPVNFLVLTPSNNRSNRIVVSFWEILGAYWVWSKCRLFYIPSGQSKSSVVVIEGLSVLFCEAVLKCLYECQLMINTTKSKLNELQIQL